MCNYVAYNRFYKLRFFTFIYLSYIKFVVMSTFREAWVYAPCERTGRNGKVHITFTHAHGT